jgi:hypothetical protein
MTESSVVYVVNGTGLKDLLQDLRGCTEEYVQARSDGVANYCVSLSRQQVEYLGMMYLEMHARKYGSS